MADPIPASVIAKWPTPNYIDPVTLGDVFPWYSGTLSIVALVAVCVRFYARKVVQKNSLTPDDWIFLSSLPFIIALVVTTNLSATIYHGNRHIWDLAPAYFADFAKISWSIELLYLLGSTLLKLSVLTFFKRLSSRSVSPSYYYISWAIILSVIAYALTFFIVLFSLCRPFQALWLSTDRHWLATHTYQCTNEAPFLLAASIISAAQDLFTALLPMIIIAKLKSVKWTQKLGIALLLSSGMVVCFFAIVRILIVYRSGYVTYDESWDRWWMALMVVSEVLLGVLCACAPAYKVCWNHWRGNEQSRAMWRTEGTGDVSLITGGDATKVGLTLITTAGKSGSQGRTRSSVSEESMIEMRNVLAYDVEKQGGTIALSAGSSSGSGSDQESPKTVSSTHS